MQENNQGDLGGMNFNSSNLLFFIVRWKKPLLIITVVSAIAAAIFSGPMFVTPKYLSSVIMFPTSDASISKSLIAKINPSKQDLLSFGEEEQAEQLIQILNSDEIRAKIIQEYDLMNHYNIDTADQFKQTKLFKEYESNISYRRTEFQSIRIDVLDSDNELAAVIANNIAELVDSVKNRMQKERAFKAMRITEAEYFEMKTHIKELEDSLNTLMLLGVNDYESMSERFNEAYAKAILEGKTAAATKLEKSLKILSMYGGAYVSIRDILEFEKEQLSHLRAKYQEAKVDAEQTLPHKFIVNSAFPAEKKSYPIRWLIVLVSAISAFTLGLFVIMIYESINKTSIK
ncbi:Wzz/FepE/Etk N-terminal domain-containing protein [Bacteroidota bacterium]